MEEVSVYVTSATRCAVGLFTKTPMCKPSPMINPCPETREEPGRDPQIHWQDESSQPCRCVGSKLYLRTCFRGTRCGCVSFRSRPWNTLPTPTCSRPRSTKISDKAVLQQHVQMRGRKPETFVLLPVSKPASANLLPSSAVALHTP